MEVDMDEHLSVPTFPELFRSGDSLAKSSQRRFFRLNRFRLIALVITAFSGAVALKVGTLDVVGVVGAVAFVCVFVLQVWSSRERLERSWYAGRAVAESVKTLGWRFAVAGNPFPRGISDEEASKRFLNRVAEINEDFRDVVISSAGFPDGNDGLSKWMLSLRSKSLAVRKRAYEEFRLQDQISWYRRKANSNRTSSLRWSSFLLSVDVLGVVTAVLKSSNIIHIDALGIVCAVGAAGTAWLQTRQHENLAVSYSVAAREIAQVLGLAKFVESESDWAKFVSDAEESISREHMTWRSSRAS